MNGKDSQTANAVSGEIAYDHNVSARLFINVFNDWQYDKFQGLDLKYVFGGGFGYHAVKTARSQLDVLGGFDYNHAKFDTPLIQSYGEYFVGDSYSLKLSRATSLVQTSAHFDDISKASAYRANFDIGASTKIASGSPGTFHSAIATCTNRRQAARPMTSCMPRASESHSPDRRERGKTMMDELINEVSAKTGLSPDQARSAITAVLGFLQGEAAGSPRGRSRQPPRRRWIRHGSWRGKPGKRGRIDARRLIRKEKLNHENKENKMNKFLKLIAGTALAAALVLPGSAFGFPANCPKTSRPRRPPRPLHLHPRRPIKTSPTRKQRAWFG